MKHKTVVLKECIVHVHGLKCIFVLGMLRSVKMTFRTKTQSAIVFAIMAVKSLLLHVSMDEHEAKFLRHISAAEV